MPALRRLFAGHRGDYDESPRSDSPVGQPPQVGLTGTTGPTGTTEPTTFRRTAAARIKRVRLRRAPLAPADRVSAVDRVAAGLRAATGKRAAPGRNRPDGHLPPWPGRSVTFDGQAVYGRRTPGAAGSEPALFVHGLGGSSTDWTDLAGMLSPWLDSDAIDLPGYGRSDPPAGDDYGQDAFAATVIKWIEHRGGSVHLFGNSLGGTIALRVAALRPDLVRTLTLVSPAMPPTSLGPVQLAMLPLLAVPPRDEWARRVLHRRTPLDEVRATEQLCLSGGRLTDRRFAEAIDQAREYRAVPWSARAQVSSFQGLVSSYLASYAAEFGGRTADESLWALARRVTAPTLVVWGWRDRLVNVRLAKPTAAALADSRLLLLPDTGHIAQVERPRMVARAVLGMVRPELATAPEPVVATADVPAADVPRPARAVPVGAAGADSPTTEPRIPAWLPAWGSRAWTRVAGRWSAPGRSRLKPA